VAALSATCLDRRLTLAVAIVALIGVGVAGYLTYVHYADIDPICAAGGGGCHKVQNEIFTIQAICQWCVGSAVLMTALAVLTTVRLLRADQDH
jgi:uncharacterized membrane protein